MAPLLSVCSPKIGIPRSCLERKASVSSCFSKYSPKLIQELLHSLASGGFPHKSVVRVYKGEGILLGFVVNAKQQRGG